MLYCSQSRRGCKRGGGVKIMWALFGYCPKIRGPICSTKKLVGHNLSGPICRGQICQGSICRGLICRGPICRKKLLRPNLPPTKFPGPNFPHSKFQGPNLSQQNFQGAQFAATKFPRGPICRQGAQSAGARFAKKWQIGPQKVRGPICRQIGEGPNLPGPNLPGPNLPRTDPLPGWFGALI